MNTTPIRIIPVALVLALAACQQQPKPAPQASPVEHTVPSAPAATVAPQAATPTAPAASSVPAVPKSTATVAKPAAPAKPSVPTAPAPVKPAATAPAAPKPAVPAAVTAKPAAPAPKPVAASMPAFSTMRCMACHAIEHDKVGPAWKTVAEKYGDAATLAKDFESGFKQRRVANAIAKWKPKEGLMTMQYKNLIKGHEKEAAHALFETVKHGHFGSY